MMDPRSFDESDVPNETASAVFASAIERQDPPQPTADQYRDLPVPTADALWPENGPGAEGDEGTLQGAFSEDSGLSELADTDRVVVAATCWLEFLATGAAPGKLLAVHRELFGS